MKYLNVSLTLLVLQSVAAVAGTNLVSLANPLQGTDSTHGFSHGNTYPAIAVPFPMNKWAPYTQPAKDSFFYQYRQNRIRGIRQTHQPSPWIADYANFSLMPVFGKLAVREDDRASEFRHDNELARPSYYKVRLDTWKATVEVTPTERAAAFRFAFDEAGDAYVVLDAFANGSVVEVVPSENKIIGVCRNNNGGVPNNFSNYFVVVFDRPFTSHGTWTPQQVQENGTRLAGAHVGAYVKFDTARGKVVECRAASSYISPAQAERNLEREIGSSRFEAVLQRADATWNEALGRIQIEGGTEEQQRTFYSALYRSVIFPHRFHEYNERNEPIYFSPYDGQIHPGYMYTDTGYWDTFRASHPLYNILFPEISGEIMQSLLAAYEQSGWLPSWSSPGHRACMIGNHAFSLLADAWVKGVTNFNAEQALEAMIHDATTPAPKNCPSIGRDGAEYYWKNGYAPYPEVREATAKTLEYAYDDFCLALFAKKIGRESEAGRFARSAMYYTNVFDAEAGFVRGRKADGSWNEKFDPTEWGGPFTEGNSWHWTWSVFQDVPGLIRLLGGDDAFGRKLDAVFYTPPDVNVGSYGNMIHEMTEMVALNMGQYAHGNQPIQHMIYLYNYVGQPWKTQARAREVMSRLYHATSDGLCGDEDTGQMSAWYVFSALGFYPVTPGTTEYVIGSPLFDRAVIQLPNGKTFSVTARGNGPQRPYIRGATVNGAALQKNFLTHDQIAEGGEVIFEMTSAPDYKWGAGKDARPGSAMDLLR
ncbi:MAG TPA: GH92 family glycosyl hydrolase [Verrucomicrobiae bacterium]|nr:GH92 family glycosyl hydrolase [Verrucomicrobiae bacterium]